MGPGMPPDKHTATFPPRLARNELVAPVELEGRRPIRISERTTVKLTLGVVVGVGLFMSVLMWRVSSQVQLIGDRLRLTEKTLKVVAKKVGVTAVDLAPNESRDDDADP
jgi:hypothetical protein